MRSPGRCGAVAWGWRVRRSRIRSVLRDGGRREDFAEDGEDVGDAEWLLEAARLVGTGGLWLDEITGHVNDDGLVDAGGGEDLLGGFLSGERMTVGNEIDIAQENVVGAFAHELDGADRSGGAVDVEAVYGEAFLEEHADAFFVVEDEDGAAAEDAGVEGANRCGKSRRNAAVERGVRVGRIRFSDNGQEDGECGAADGKRFDVNGAAVLADDRGADAEAEAGAAAGTLSGVERVEEF